MKYFEDYNLSLTQRLWEIAILGQPPRYTLATMAGEPAKEDMIQNVMSSYQVALNEKWINEDYLRYARFRGVWHLFGEVVKG